MFIHDAFYTRKQAWSILNPKIPFPNGGNWLTGYVVHDTSLIVFANIDSPGRTGHDFPNEYDHEERVMCWFGKPNAHSQQQTFRKLFDGELTPHIFVRWDNKNTKFLYLGVPSISSFTDGVKIKEGLETIKLMFEWDPPKNNPPPEGSIIDTMEGNRLTSVTNRYERNPALRSTCIDHHGITCQVCGFDFESAYGELGRDYCQVHHITPLFEVAESHYVDPLNDLIPLCANCHAMIHRGKKVLLPDQLKAIVNRHK